MLTAKSAPDGPGPPFHWRDVFAALQQQDGVIIVQIWQYIKEAVGQGDTVTTRVYTVYRHPMCRVSAIEVYQ
jgi:hypothetical protein